MKRDTITLRKGPNLEQQGELRQRLPQDLLDAFGSLE